MDGAAQERARLRDRHPRFDGDWDALARLQQVVDSPINTDERGAALAAWREYNFVGTLPAGAVDSQTDRMLKVAKWQDYRKPRGAVLRGASLSQVIIGTIDLSGADLVDVDFRKAKLKRATFDDADLQRADLREALLLGASFRNANLSQARLTDAQLESADFTGARLDGADVSGADLTNATLVAASIAGACLDGAVVHGVSAWDIEGEPRSSANLVITREPPSITVDDLKVAQFIYLLYRNPEIRDVLDTVTQKVVLILGRFTPERKAVLDALRERLRRRDFVPVLFDFDVPQDRNITETVTLLARMARFVVADLTDPASIPQELQAIAPGVKVPIRLIIQAGERPYAMSRDLLENYWVLPPFRYADLQHLLAHLDGDVIAPAEDCRREIARRREAAAAAFG
jgi:uncharacterized protein YjbI with pentapeptide repeats